MEERRHRSSRRPRRIVTAVDTANQSTAEVTLFPSDIYSLLQEKL